MTSISPKSRNYSFGIIIGHKKNPKEVDEYLKNNTVEGYYTLQSIYSLLKRRNIKIPIIDIIYRIVINGEDPTLLTNFLLIKK